MRICTLILSVVCVVLWSNSGIAQEQKFPYRAVVVDDEALVRSGGDESFYPTQRLTRDTVVTVRRHDRGGWYAIDPPEGSFSWVQARYVKTDSGDHGVITEDGVVAFVGSEFGDETSVWQRRLTAGTEIKVLGQQEIDTVSGRQQMLKISPPVRERRWINGSALVPVDDEVRKQHDNNPYSVPSGVARRTRPPAGTGVAQPAPSAQLTRLRQTRQEQKQLAEIDQRFRNMLGQNPADWDLASIEQEYEELRSAATWRPLAAQIDLRFPAIDRYRQRQAKYERFQQLTSQTEERDAELLAQQFAGPNTTSMSDLASTAETAPAPQNGPDGLLPFDVAEAEPRGQLDAPSTALEGLQLPSSGMFESTVPSIFDSAAAGPQIDGRSRYVGAGIVRRMSDGGFALMSPGGQQLAQLRGSDSVNLAEFEGKQVGLHGKREFQRELGTDLIEVSGLEPVRIRP